MTTHPKADRPSGGKYGKRPCPALGGTISPSDCGIRRGSELACPSDCPYFPFGRPNDNLWLRVDDSWAKKAVDYLVGRWPLTRLQELVRRLTVPMPDPDLELQCATRIAILHALFLIKDDGGKTLAERWEAENWAGLNNDERLMMRCQREARPTVVEVQRVVDHQTIECIDLLDQARKPFLLIDQGIAPRTVRFSRVFAWLAHYPHFCRVAANAAEIPHPAWPEWWDTVTQRHRSALSTRPELDLKTHLAETVVACTRLIAELVDAHRQRLLANPELQHCRSLFRYSCPPKDLEQVFRGSPDFLPDPEPTPTSGPTYCASYRWVRRGESTAVDPESARSARGQTTGDDDADVPLGHAQIFEDHVVFETLSRRRHDFLRGLVERQFGSLLSFETESFRNFATILAERERREQTVAAAEQHAYADELLESAAVDEAEETSPGTPSPDVSRRTTLQAEIANTYRDFPDKPLSALGGVSPRAAAADPERRPQLVEVMKAHVCGLANRSRREGMKLDIDWLLDELGLQELK